MVIYFCIIFLNELEKRIINFNDGRYLGGPLNEHFKDTKIKTWFDAFEIYFKLYIVLVIFKELNIKIDERDFITKFSLLNKTRSPGN